VEPRVRKFADELINRKFPNEANRFELSRKVVHKSVGAPLTSFPNHERYPMNLRTLGFTLSCAGALATLPAAADPLANAYHSGLFRRAEADPKTHPLPPHQRLEAVAGADGLRIRDHHGDRFVFQALSSHPTAAGVEPKDLSGDFPEDGATFAVPVDLTGSGVSDLIYARQGGGGFQVLSNGTRLPHPFQGFVAGFCPKDQDVPKGGPIAVDTSELKVDHDLLAVTGDFLGNGTEQVAYTRPGWNQMWVVGAHGAVQLSIDLQGIQPNGPGPRVHWLFPFAPTGAHHTRIAYYRMGCNELVCFRPGGMTFKRDQAPLKGNWEKLQQSVLEWPQPAPAQAEEKKP
jgi:hypothetical protein